MTKYNVVTAQGEVRKGVMDNMFDQSLARSKDLCLCLALKYAALQVQVTINARQEASVPRLLENSSFKPIPTFLCKTRDDK